jgi:hypothetical protein
VKRSKPMARSAFRRKDGPNVHGSERPMAPLRALARMPNYAGSTTCAMPKTIPQRNRRLLDLAEGKPCLLLVPGCCNHRTDTTVACHSNLSVHGKGGRRKADDQFSVFGCAACHWWLDFGPAPEEQKTAVFLAGMGRQLLAWEQIEADPAQAPADRRAARWALERHPERSMA